MKRLDHRGLVPASLYNKTMAAVDSVEWVRTNMGSGQDTEFGFSQYANSSGGYVQWERDKCVAKWEGITVELIDADGDGTPETPGGPKEPPHGNSVWIGGNPFAIADETWRSSASFSFSSTGFGRISILNNLPKDAEILEAKAEVFCSGATRDKVDGAYASNTCDGWADDGWETSSTTFEDVGFSVLGFTTLTDFEVVGSMSGSGETGVKDITDIAKAMQADVAGGKYVCYGLVMGIFANGGLDVIGMLPGEGPRRGKLNPKDCDEHYVVPACAPATEEYYTYFHDYLTWGNLTFGNVYLRIKYPESSKKWFIMPRLPAMN